MNRQELQFVAKKSKKWDGPYVWGFADGCRLNLNEVIKSPQYG